jgi:hypothetical protein
MTTILNVSNSLNQYIINGAVNPILNLFRGQTYEFVINALGQPFWIQTSLPYNPANVYSSGITNNGSDLATLTFVVPMDAPNQLYYVSQFTPTMNGAIYISDEPTPLPNNGFSTITYQPNTAVIFESTDTLNRVQTSQLGISFDQNLLGGQHNLEINGLGISYNDVGTTWPTLQAKVAAIQAVTSTNSATKLVLNNSLQVQNTEGSVVPTEYINITPTSISSVSGIDMTSNTFLKGPTPSGADLQELATVGYVQSNVPPSAWVGTAATNLDMNGFNITSQSAMTIGVQEKITNLIGIVKIPNDLIVGDPLDNETVRIYGGQGGSSYNNVGTQNDIQLNLAGREQNALYVAAIIPSSSSSTLTLPLCKNSYNVKVINGSNSTWTIRGQVNEPIVQGPAGPGLLNPNGVTIGPYQTFSFLQVNNISGKFNIMDTEMITGTAATFPSLRCPNYDSGGPLNSVNVATVNAGGVNIGRTTQPTNLLGNVQFNGLSGSAGQVLTSTGAGSAPTWVTSAGGPTGPQGPQGDAGPTGPQGADGFSSNLYNYQARTETSGIPANGHLYWDTTTQVSATTITFSHLTQNGNDIDLFLSVLKSGDSLVIQDQNNSDNFQRWIVSAVPTVVPNSYVIVPVTFSSSGGTAQFAQNHQVIAIIQNVGPPGPAGPTGPQGPAGPAGPSVWVGTATTDLNMNGFNITSPSALTIGNTGVNTTLQGDVLVSNSLVIEDGTDAWRFSGGTSGGVYTEVSENNIQTRLGLTPQNFVYSAVILSNSTASTITLPNVKNGYYVYILNTSLFDWNVASQSGELIAQGIGANGVSSIVIKSYQTLGFIQYDNALGKYNLLIGEVIAGTASTFPSIRCPNYDSTNGLSLGGTTSLGVSIGRATQTTDIKGNLQINSLSGSAGQVLTSTGAGSAPTWQAGGGGSSNITHFKTAIDTGFSALGTNGLFSGLTITVPSTTATYLMMASMTVGSNGTQVGFISFSFASQAGAVINNFGGSKNIVGGALLTVNLRMSSANCITQQQTSTAGYSSVNYQYIYTPGVVGQTTFAIFLSLASGSIGSTRQLSSFNMVQLTA